MNLFIQIWIGSSIKVPFIVNHTRDCIALNFYSWVISSESNRLLHDQFHFWAKSFSLFDPKFRFNFEITNFINLEKKHLHNTRFTVDLSRQWVNVIVKTKEIINNSTNGPKQRKKSAKNEINLLPYPFRIIKAYQIISAIAIENIIIASLNMYCPRQLEFSHRPIMNF